MSRTTRLIVYIILLVPSFLLVSINWSLLTAYKLFYCSDWVPILDFFPPFVHGTQRGDYFIYPPYVVYFLWIIAVIIMLSLPLPIIKLINGFIKERLQQKVVKSKPKKKNI
ncbi:MAG TPA: hypothetical protein VM077_04360 [Candidatus Limnocylindrales bacterium]|nr:hypothetical protein [Candidatus Limnocylindrales bacterium]